MKKMKFGIRENAQLLKKCRRIFGAGVVNAWDCSYYASDDSRADIKAEFDAQRKKKDDGEKELDYSGQKIIIEFRDGVQVMFSNSEWGSITRIDEKSIELIEL